MLLSSDRKHASSCPLNVYRRVSGLNGTEETVELFGRFNNVILNLNVVVGHLGQLQLSSPFWQLGSAVRLAQERRWGTGLQVTSWHGACALDAQT